MKKAERFLRPNPSEHIVKAHRLLGKVGDTDAASRIYASATHDKILAQWTAQYEVTPSKLKDWHLCVVGLPCPETSHGCHISEDHISLWDRNGKPAIYVQQPYELTHNHMRQIDKVCSKLGLEYQISSALSWHFPGRTLLLEIYRPGEHNAP